MGSNGTARRWIFVVNNPTDDEQSALKVPHQKIRYMVWQLEAGENNTPHIQGYCELSSPVRLSGVKQIVGQRAHVEKAITDQSINRTYCTKEPRLDGPFEYGTPGVTQGSRTDIQACIDTVLESGSVAAAEQHPVTYAKFYRGIEHVAKLRKTEKRNWKTEVWWLTGNPGSGKSFYADRTIVDSSSVYRKPMGRWFPGYDGQSDIIWDEISENEDFSLLLQCMDQYGLCVETKGGHTEYLAKKLVITSTMTPQEWCIKNKNLARLGELCRRIDHLIVCSVKIVDGQEDVIYEQTEVERVFGTRACDRAIVVSYMNFTYTKY